MLAYIMYIVDRSDRSSIHRSHGKSDARLRYAVRSVPWITGVSWSKEMCVYLAGKANPVYPVTRPIAPVKSWVKHETPLYTDGNGMDIYTNAINT